MGLQPQLGSKAQTLASLVGQLSTASVLPLFAFTVARWEESSPPIIEEILAQPWAHAGVIVRSSAAVEDASTASRAGHFSTVLDVRGPSALDAAVRQVIASYAAESSSTDEVLIQPMLAGVLRSGVAFSVDPSTGAPYRVVEWVEGEDTGAVTGGRAARAYLHAQHSPIEAPPFIRQILDLVEELEGMFPDRPLDIEFAATSSLLYVLQVRPLITTPQVDATRHQRILDEIAGKVSRGMGPHPFLHGRRTIYGVMPDWNPAEIIGIRPRPLALSLYRELIADSIWAYQRNNYGYKNLRSHPLLRHFHGLPYIDVRVSFNSFLPRDIDAGLADRLVDYYLDLLESRPELHDKVEFEIVFSCYTFDLPQRMRRLQDAGFTEAECGQLAEALKHLTNRVINAKTGLWREDRARIATLAERRAQLYAAAPDAISRIYWLLEDCKRYGTLPFCGLARAGFIAVEMLRSLVSVAVLSSTEYDHFVNSLHTVSGQLSQDFGCLDREPFLAKYGHLRPGTYDILSARYDEAPELYFHWNRVASPPAVKERFSLSLSQMRDIADLLAVHGLDSDVIGLFDFIHAGIEQRELSKFEFTRNVSDAIAAIGELGQVHGFSREDMSFVSVEAIYELYAGSSDPRLALSRSIEEGRERYAQTCTISLPPLVSAVRDVWSFAPPANSPNFITQKRVTAAVVSSTDPEHLPGAIVCIRSADPGFDWVFSHRIAGLITAYGGANSHMAVRANELGLPAVIGAGERSFEQWSRARELAIDCANRKVEILA